VYQDLWLHFWNPSTRTISKKIGHIFRLFRGRSYKAKSIKFTFGYDSSSDTYKVVAIKFNGYNVRTIEAKIFSLGENAWRNVEIFPVVLLQLIGYDCHAKGGVCLSGTFNWLSVFDSNVLDVE
jgi:F-box interacting protein